MPLTGAFIVTVLPPVGLVVVSPGTVVPVVFSNVGAVLLSVAAFVPSVTLLSEVVEESDVFTAAVVLSSLPPVQAANEKTSEKTKITAKIFARLLFNEFTPFVSLCILLDN